MKNNESGFRKLITACVIAILWLLSIAFVAEAARGQGYCTKRGMEVSGVSWKWERGNVCVMAVEAPNT